jgi:hypothetical protein
MRGGARVKDHRRYARFIPRFMQIVADRCQPRAPFDTVTPSTNHLTKEPIMKNAILNYMEAIFLASLVIIAGTNFAAAKMPSATKPHSVAANVPVDGNVYTVTVSAKRMPRNQG